MVARNRGRYLAPIAIAIVIAVTILIVQGQLAPGHHARPRNQFNGLLRRHAKKAATFYIVKSGDTLSVISVKTGITVPTLESLNPGINPNALQTGQRLKLRQ